MKRNDRIKLDFTRNWKLPGKKRIAGWLRPSAGLKTALQNSITWLTDEDIAIYTSADNYIEWCIITDGTYEDEINKIIRISLKPGGVALDIGGNIGLQSIRMAQAIGPQGMVYAFEPLHYLQKKFSKNISLNRLGNVTLLPFALSNTEAETEMKINSNSWNQGTFSISNTAGGTETQLVTIKVADELPEIKELDRLHLIKIDVEGFEYQVLQGLKLTIQKHKPRIIFEYDANYWQANGQNITDCYNFLRSFNYTLYQITTAGCELIKGAAEIESGNLFCINTGE